ncbi:hypothetical protein Z517_08220 [Fonsecaea pedrosoi CBS 271.37]|uniref:Copper-fist domain-containing protein n=1 Tax=Fonsecaea pedrosoi CBS 271.37 TaxID=1442368 RepID=A0A0D2GIJ8_9EURO|nr:uncharacterized protein Z517_08220 [Fonsecaea pedrosoi CBS 271.37]KIW78385.1 hypothetical protein Z517_08220 [Fonsecaea pedrosoi CBS 271.37]
MISLIRRKTVLMKSRKGNLHTCCCQHGSRCNCALKKDHLDPVPEDISQLLQPKDHAKHRHNMNSHDPKTTIFTNGHHKPVHKFNDAHNQLGAPYKIPSRSNSLHGHREIAQRSTDSLPLTKFAKPFHESPLHNSISEAMQVVERRVKSEHNSPVLGPTRMAGTSSIQDFKIPNFDPRAYAYSPFGTDTPPTQPNSLPNSQNPSLQDLTLPERFPENWFMTFEQAHDYEPPPWARFTEGSSTDWNNINLDGSNGLYSLKKENSPYMLSQQIAFQASELTSQINRVGITSSSEEPSEVEDQSPPSVANPWGADRAVGTDRQTGLDTFNDYSSVGGDDASDRFRLSSASSYFGTPQANMLANENIGSLDIDDYLKQAEAETKRMQLQHQLAQMQMNPQDSQTPSRLSSVSRGMTPSISTPGSTGNVEHPYTISEAQRYAHPDGGSNLSVDHPRAAIPPSYMADDPAWSVAPDMTNPELSLNDEREDEDWVR